MKRRPHLGAAVAVAVLALGGLPAGQTTHSVSVSGLSFSPQDLKIDLGDTVRWVWGNGLHNVESGVNGIPDGAFTSGVPVAQQGNVFSVVFDPAFLAAHPHSGNAYPYYCVVHLGFGMTGTVTVRTPAASVPRNGSGLNPAGFVETQPAVLGGTWRTTVDIATPGAVASVVAVANAPLQVLSGFGELLVDVGDLAAPPSLAAGVHAIPIPNDCLLLGLELFAQAATLRVGKVQLQNALDVRLGV